MTNPESQTPAPQSPASERDTPWGLIVVAALAVYAILIVLMNREEVAISFVFFSATISKLVLILLCLGIGFVAGYLFDRWRADRRAGDAKTGT